MSPSSYRFEIAPSVPLAEAEMSLHLAMIVLEGLYGASGVRLDAHYRLDEAGRALVVDGSTRVGLSLVRVFAALLAREFGDGGFDVRRVAGGGTGDDAVAAGTDGQSPTPATAEARSARIQAAAQPRETRLGSTVASSPPPPDVSDAGRGRRRRLDDPCAVDARDGKEAAR